MAEIDMTEVIEEARKKLVEKIDENLNRFGEEPGVR